MSTTATESVTPRRPPGPRGAPMLGSLGALRRDPLAFFRDLHATHGRIAEFRLPGMRACSLYHPDDLRHVLVHAQGSYIKSRLYRRLDYLFGEGMLLTEGETWRAQRRRVQPAYARDRLEGYVTLMVEETERLLATWPAAPVLDLAEEMARLTQRIIVRAMFSAERDLAAEAGGAWATLNAFLSEHFWSLVPWASRLPLPGNLPAHRAQRRLDAIISAVVAERRRTGVDHGDLLAMLLDAQAALGTSDRQLRDEIMVTLAAGHESTGVALAWTWRLLATHPEWQARARAEVDAVLGGRTPTADDARRLPAVRAVIDEAMRLYPPAWMFTRSPVTDDVIGGWTVPRGRVVFLLPWVTHRSPDLWDDPDEFRPTRFLSDGTSDPATAFQAAGRYLPFGLGPRKCIGYHFALLEATVVVAMLLQRIAVEPVDARPVLPEPLITLRPAGGVRLRVLPAH